MAKYCTSCGSQMEENSKFCQKCGSPQDDNELVNSGNSKSTNVTGSVNNGTGSRSKIAAGLLGVFLGGWGIHNFYLGYTTKGVIQIVVTIITCGIGAIWGFIEGILILVGSINTDADGNPLTD